MPGLIDRLTSLFKVKLNKALDAAEDPGEMLDFSYEQMLQQLQKVRMGIADVATAKARIQGQLLQLQNQEQHLDDQAREALSVGREDLARTALARKVALAPQLQALANQVEDLDAQQNKLIDGESNLAARIQAFKAHKETMKAQYTAAQANVRINEAVTGLSEEMGDVRIAMERAQNKIEMMQARAAALEGLAGGTTAPQLGPGVDDIDVELARMKDAAAIESQLQAIRSSLPPGPAQQQLAPPPNANEPQIAADTEADRSQEPASGDIEHGRYTTTD